MILSLFFYLTLKNIINIYIFINLNRYYKKTTKKVIFFKKTVDLMNCKWYIYIALV